MDTKLSAVQAAMQADDWQLAIRLAARFQRLGEHRNAILDAHGAYTNPRFAAQLGRDIEALKTLGRNALVARYTRETLV